MAEKRIHIAIADEAPIISAGLSHTMGRLPAIPVRVMEINSHSDLKNCLKTEQPDILIVSPFFGGFFDPALARTSNPTLKIVAVAAGPIDRKILDNFDSVISIADDIETITEKIKKLVKSKEGTEVSKEPLSNREKEIIVNIVKGFTNKEIADKLFLSVHTVITHRRNIARKLEIHSATGLTIYAIVNKLVDIADLNL